MNPGNFNSVVAMRPTPGCVPYPQMEHAFEQATGVGSTRPPLCR